MGTVCSSPDKSPKGKRQITPNFEQQSDAELLDDFKTFLPTKWKSQTEVSREFGRLRSCIDKSEFHKLFTEQMGYDGDVDHTFDLLDVNKAGFIRKGELRKFVCGALLEEAGGTKSRKSGTSKPTKAQYESQGRQISGGSQISKSERQISGGSDASIKRNCPRRMSDSDIGASTELLDFQVYFHRRPNRVQSAFAKLRFRLDEEVDLNDFAQFMKESLGNPQYTGDATKIFTELGKAGGSTVTWADIKALLELPPPLPEYE